MKDYRQLAAFMRLYKSRVTDRTYKTMVKVATEVRDDAKKLVPVDTGALRDSIAVDTQWDAHGITFHIKANARSNGVKYAEFVEFGTGIYNEHGDGRKTPWKYQKRDGTWVTTRGSRPHPFIRPAFRAHMGELTQYMRKAIRVDGGAP